jgi:uncharacterized integral membrane protein
VKAFRIAQVIALVAFAVYLLLFHNANPSQVDLPLLRPLPPAVLVAIVAVVGYLLGFTPYAWRAWRLQRKLDACSAERSRLAAAVERFERGEPSDPVIPDRQQTAVPAPGDPSDHL